MTAEILRILGMLCLLGALGYLAYLLIPSGKSNPTPERSARRTPAEWGEIADRSEGYEPGHAGRVASYAVRLAGSAGLDSKAIASLEEAAFLHDVGEIDWCSELLSRNGPLDTEERWLMAEHAARGQKIAQKASEFPWSHLWVRWHHERYDGTGYPDGLWADEIPIESRILAIADAFDAMRSPRPYRGAMDPDEAITEIQRLAGISYDPRLVQLFAEFALSL